MAPVAADGMVFAVDVTGRVYGLDAETGAEVWDQALNDPSRLTPPVLAEITCSCRRTPERSPPSILERASVVPDRLRGLVPARARRRWESPRRGTGSDDARIVAFAEDPNGVLIDEPSPTTVDIGEAVGGLRAGRAPVAIVALALARPLQRRLGPTPLPDAAVEEGAG